MSHNVEMWTYSAFGCATVREAPWLTMRPHGAGATLTPAISVSTVVLRILLPSALHGNECDTHEINGIKPDGLGRREGEA